MKGNDLNNGQDEAYIADLMQRLKNMIDDDSEESDSEPQDPDFDDVPEEFVEEEEPEDDLPDEVLPESFQDVEDEIPEVDTPEETGEEAFEVPESLDLPEPVLEPALKEQPLEEPSFDVEEELQQPGIPSTDSFMQETLVETPQEHFDEVHEDLEQAEPIEEPSHEQIFLDDVLLESQVEQSPSEEKPLEDPVSLDKGFQSTFGNADSIFQEMGQDLQVPQASFIAQPTVGAHSFEDLFEDAPFAREDDSSEEPVEDVVGVREECSTEKPFVDILGVGADCSSQEEVQNDEPVQDVDLELPVQEQPVLQSKKSAPKKSSKYQLVDYSCFKKSQLSSTVTGEEKIRWKKEVKSKETWGLVKVIASSFLTVLLFLYNNFPAFTKNILDILLLSRIREAYPLIDLQLLLLVALINYSSFEKAFITLQKKQFIPETACLILLFEMILYDIANCIWFYSSSILLSSITALFLTVLSISEYVKVRSDAITLKGYLMKKHQYVASISSIKEQPQLSSALPNSADASSIETLEYPQEFDFMYARSSVYEHRSNALVVTIISSVLMLASFIVTFILHQEVQKALAISFVTGLSAMCVGTFALHKWLFAALTSRVGRERVSVSSEKSAYDISKIQLMVFDDTEAFPQGSISLNKIILCGNYRLDKAVNLAATAFHFLGGPLSKVFLSATDEVYISENIQLLESYKEGYRFAIDGEKISIGTALFIKEQEMDVLYDQNDQNAEENGLKLLYLAVDNQLFAKFYLKYTIEDSFESDVDYYIKQHVQSIIVTRDPNITQQLIDKISYLTDSSIKVIRKTDFSEANIKQIDLLTYGPRKTLRRMPFFFRKYLKIQNTTAIVNIVCSILLGAGVMALLLLLNFPILLTGICAVLASFILSMISILNIKLLNPNQ